MQNAFLSSLFMQVLNSLKKKLHCKQSIVKFSRWKVQTTLWYLDHIYRPYQNNGFIGGVQN